MKHDVEVRIGSRTALTSLLIIYARALDGWIFGEPDSFAWVQEWQIGRGKLLRRSYRDARFAALLECGLCRGRGIAGHASSTEAGCPAATVAEADPDPGTGTVIEAGTQTWTGTWTGSGTGTGTGKGCSLCDGTGRIDRLWLREGRRPRP